MVPTRALEETIDEVCFHMMGGQQPQSNVDALCPHPEASRAYLRAAFLAAPRPPASAAQSAPT